MISHHINAEIEGMPFISVCKHQSKMKVASGKCKHVIKMSYFVNKIADVSKIQEVKSFRYSFSTLS